MKAGRQRWLQFAAILLPLVVPAPPAHGQCVSHDRTTHVERFSAIKDIAGLSNPSGIELVLEENGTRVTGTLRDYEGLPDPFITRLKGTLRNCDVDVSGSNRRGEVEIHGKIVIASFECTITRHIAGEAYSEKVSLRREPPQPDDTAQLNVSFPLHGWR